MKIELKRPTEPGANAGDMFCGHPDDDPRNHTLGGGLTKLEWFAGRALPGIIAQPNLEGWDPSVLARWAFEIGVEMVERSKTLNRESPEK